MKNVPNSADLGYIFPVTLWRVMTNSDLTEGRGSQRTLGWFADPNVAAKAARGNYVMGSDCPVEQVVMNIIKTQAGKVFLLGEEVQIQYEDPREIRARAIAKLTPEERQVLGIKG